MNKWLDILKTVGLASLRATKLAPIADTVAVIIEEAEAIHGAKTGPDKLTHVIPLVLAAAEAAHAAGVKIDPADVQRAAAGAVSTAVTVTNIVHKAHGDE